MTNKQPAETFPVCEFLNEEIVARGWSVETFCARTGLSRHLAEEIRKGHRRLTKLTATCLELGMGISRDCWLRLQEYHESAEETKKQEQA